MGQIIHLSQKRIEIVLYTRGIGMGDLGSARHAENEQALAIITGVVKELGHWYFTVRTRSWPTHFYETIVRGGWWSPVVTVDRIVVSHGCLPDRVWLRGYLNEQMHILRPRLAKSS